MKLYKTLFVNCLMMRSTYQFINLFSSRRSFNIKNQINSKTYSSANVHEIETIQTNLLDAFGNNSTSTISFFKFIELSDPDKIVDGMKFYLSKYNECKGTIYIANEGINGALHLQTSYLVDLKNTLGNLDSNFKDIHFNIGDTISSGSIKPFKKLLIKARPRILTDGLKNDLVWNDNGIELSAAEWHTSIQEGRPLLIDCRNDFESQLGRFVNAKPLETKVFSESWEKLDSMLEAVPKDTKIMTYCTGGIRCIKVNAYLKQKLGFKNIFRLGDGIISYENWVSNKYFTRDSQSKPINSLFQGENYIFDSRRILSSNETLDPH